MTPWRADEARGDDRLRILVVAGLLTGGLEREEDRATRQLILSLHQQCRDCELTVLSVDSRSPSGAIDAYRKAGITLMAGNGDWAGELRCSAYAYSHVFITDSALRAPVLERVIASQPQATKVIYFSDLAFRSVAALAPVTPGDELEGLEFVRAQAEAWLLEQARSVNALWCERDQDARFLASLLPHIPVALIPPAVEDLGGGAPFGDRSGVVLVATEGHDVLAGNEDAALLAMNEVLPAVARRGRPVDCTLVADWPSPMLESAACRHRVSVVGSSQLVPTLGSSRLVLLSHNYGSGGGSIIHAALGSTTPFVASPQAAAGLPIGPLESYGVRGDLADVAHCVRVLLHDEQAWTQYSEAIRTFATGYLGPDARAKAVRAALPNLGIVPQRAVSGCSVRGADLAEPRRALRATPVRLRPGGAALHSPVGFSDTSDPVTRYQLWSERFGQHPGVLQAIAADLEKCKIQPTISILMPVYNTDGDVLRATTDSVLAQIYGKWQLCIADDGSDRPETREALEELATDARVVITRLGGQSGISAATNAALGSATGDWVALLDHDDLLKPHALAQVVRWINADPDLDVVYSDEDKIDEQGALVQPHLKPDWSPDQLMSQNYVCHLTVARRSLVESVGGLRSQFDGSQDYDLILRLVEQSDHIGHIPEPLYTWRMVPGSTAAVVDAKPYAFVAARHALEEALARRGVAGRVEEGYRPGHFRTRYTIPGKPKVTIIIPTKDRLDLLQRCVESVLERSTYSNFEILIIDNQSRNGDTLQYLAGFPGRVIRYPYRFNYARMMNLAARRANADALLFLNNDTEVITPDWIEGLLEHAMRPEVGAVGCRLFWGDRRPQHEGILVGVKGWAINVDHEGFWGRGDVVRNASAVTGACTMIRPSVYWAVGGNDERLRIAYNDVDICLRIRQAGLQVVYTPYAELYHYESSTRSGQEHRDDGPLFGLRWQPRERVDPYYSPLMEPDQLFQIRL